MEKGERRENEKKKSDRQQTVIVNTSHVTPRERGRCKASYVTAEDKRKKISKPDLFFLKKKDKEKKCLNRTPFIK